MKIDLTVSPFNESDIKSTSERKNMLLPVLFLNICF